MCVCVQLSQAFVSEILFACDMLGDQENAFSILYDDFIQRGLDAHQIQSQLQYDDSNPSGLPAIADGSLVSSTLSDNHPVTSEQGSADLKCTEGKTNVFHFWFSLFAFFCSRTIFTISNPKQSINQTDDEREECQQTLAIRDPRYGEFDRWESKVQPFYVHQPLEEALAWRSEIDSKQPKTEGENSPYPFKPIAKFHQTSVTTSTSTSDVAAKTESKPVLETFSSYPVLDTCSANDRKSMMGSQATIATTTLPNFSSEKLEIDSVPPQNVAVLFVAKWCPHSEALLSACESAMQQPSTKDSVDIGVVDIDAYPQVASAFGVTRFPTVMFFPKGQKMHADAANTYHGPSNQQELASWFRSLSEPAAQTVASSN